MRGRRRGERGGNGGGGRKLTEEDAGDDDDFFSETGLGLVISVSGDVDLVSRKSAYAPRRSSSRH